jgi:hypothetical protein
MYMRDQGGWEGGNKDLCCPMNQPFKLIQRDKYGRPTSLALLYGTSLDLCLLKTSQKWI